METKKKKLPVGIEMFRDIREHEADLLLLQLCHDHLFDLRLDLTFSMKPSGMFQRLFDGRFNTDSGIQA